jgi:hypothetical protein
MKKFTLLASVITSIAFFANAEDQKDLPGYRATYLEQTLDLDYLSTSPAKSHHGTFSFSDAHAVLYKTISQNSFGDVSVLGGLRRVHMKLGSKIRPQNTLYGVIGSTIEYSKMDRWNWDAGFSIQPDVNSFDLVNSTRYIGAIHGRYAYTDSIGVHAGIYAELGMRATSVNPIIGADYKTGPWLYQAIFPQKAGISYTGFSHHIFSFMVRPFFTAVKVHKGNYHHPAVALYNGNGAEFRYDLTPNPMWNFWISLGHTFGSSLTIGNRNFHRQKDMHINQAPYMQIGLNIAL